VSRHYQRYLNELWNRLEVGDSEVVTVDDCGHYRLHIDKALHRISKDTSEERRHRRWFYCEPVGPEATRVTRVETFDERWDLRKAWLSDLKQKKRKAGPSDYLRLSALNH